MPHRPFVRSLLGIAAITTLSAPAFADVPRADRDRADALFEEAKSLMVQSRFLEACPKLVEARRIDPGAGGTVLALALCREGEQKLATALAELREAKRMALATKNADRVALATEHIDALGPHVSKLVIKRGDRSAAVTVDGAPVGAAEAVEVDGGEHVVRVESPGAPAWEQRISVATKDDSREVDLPEPPAIAPVTVSAPVEPARVGPRTRTAGLVVGGVGIAAVLVGGYFGVRALQAQSDSNDVCPTSPCARADGVARHTDAQHAAVAADLGIGIGLAAVAGGVILVVIDKRGDAPSAIVAPSFSERAAGLAVSGHF